MAESTLSAAYTDLEGDVGHFLGYGRGTTFQDAAWTVTQQNDIDRSIKGGLRKFYFCDFDWSFLKPTASLTLVSATSTVPLPDDFGSFEGQITLSATTGIQWWPLDLVSPGIVDLKAAMFPTTTGRPVMACLDPLKGTTPTAGQRFQLRFWPIADQSYPLRFRYYLLPDYLSGAFPYVYGGAEHAETVLSAARSVAEKIIDNAATVEEFEFEKLLAVSKDIDRRKKPQTLGYCRDNSDVRDRALTRPFWHGWAPVTINGVQY